jgi:hypothetical protein
MDKAESLLREAYKYAELEAPYWLSLKAVVESIDEVYEDLKESVRSFIVNKINDEYTKYVGKVVVEYQDRSEWLQKSELEMKDRAKIVIEKQLIPWLIGKGDIIYITTE